MKMASLIQLFSRVRWNFVKIFFLLIESKQLIKQLINVETDTDTTTINGDRKTDKQKINNYFFRTLFNGQGQTHRDRPVNNKINKSKNVTILYR